MCQTLTTFLLHPLLQLISKKTNLEKILMKPLKSEFIQENSAFVSALKHQQQQQQQQQQQMTSI